MKNTKKVVQRLIVVIFLFAVTVFTFRPIVARAMPFYGLNPKHLTVRSTFSTTYEKSTEDRKSNIKLAVRSINNTIVDVGGEFSFNSVVGPRTEKRGYKTSKIIVGGEFVDGVGGGVCQVSTTLYNAVVLAGLIVTEYHPHSLPVSYVPPSRDAMVNSGSADLRFVNCTNNPLIIKATATDTALTIKIIGEPLQVEYLIQSTVKETIPAPDYVILKDVKGEYPNLYEGERLYLSYSKDGVKSRADVVTIKNGKTLSKTKLRTDTYKAVQGRVIEGTAIRKDAENDFAESIED